MTLGEHSVGAGFAAFSGALMSGTDIAIPVEVRGALAALVIYAVFAVGAWFRLQTARWDRERERLEADRGKSPSIRPPAESEPPK